MKVLSLVCLGMAYLHLIGLGLASIVFRSPQKQLVAAPFLGFASVQLIFGAAVLLRMEPVLSFYLAALFPALFIPLAAKNVKAYFAYLATHARDVLLHVVIVVAILGMTAWPMFYYDSLEAYYHSGALDLVQDVSARQAMGIYTTGIYKEGYIVNHVLQYTSPAFWFHFFGIRSITIILVQYLMLLVLMYSGIYSWLTRVMLQTPRTAILVALLSCSSTFYITSFINYHGGTMMVLAVCFFMLVVFHEAAAAQVRREKVALFTCFAVLSVYFLFAYNYAIYVIYFIGLFAVRWMPRINSFVRERKLLTAVIVVSGYAALLVAIHLITANSEFYMAIPHPFERNVPGYRPWETIRSEVGPLFYWGMLPSLVMGQGYLGLREVYSVPARFYPLLAAAVFLTILALQGTAIASRNRPHLRATYLFIGTIFPAFVFFLDPYYTYKVLYTTQPLFIFALVTKLQSMRSPSASAVQRKYLWGLSMAVAGFAIAANIFTSAVENENLLARSYNRTPEIIHGVLNVPQDVLMDAAFLVRTQEKYWLFQNELLGARGAIQILPPLRAKYLVYDKTERDITPYPDGPPVAQYGDFLVYLAKDFVAVDDYYHQPELESLRNGSRAVRLLYNRHTRDPKTDALTLECSLSFAGDNSSGRYKFVQIGIAPELSVNYKPITLRYTLNGTSGVIDVSGNDLHYIPLGDAKRFRLKLWYEGQIVADIFPLDQREFVAKMFDVRLVADKYSVDSLTLLNPGLDSDARNVAVFGNGWHGIESDDFRWGANEPEIVVVDPAKGKDAALNIDLEPGPSMEKLPISIELLDSDRRVIGRADNIAGRTTVRFDLVNATGAASGYLSLYLRTKGSIKRLQSDPRDLNLRVFSMKVD